MSQNNWTCVNYHRTCVTEMPIIYVKAHSHHIFQEAKEKTLHSPHRR